MLHYLDVMIGFVFTMLVLSLAVTAMVQAVPVYLGNLRGASLERGLADMLIRMAHGTKLPADEADRLGLVVNTILRDPLLSSPRTGLLSLLYAAFAPPYTKELLTRPRAAVIQREEFVRLLLDFAAGDEAKDQLLPVKQARISARQLLGVNTALEAQALLTHLRTRIAELEKQHHDWSSSRRADQAMMEILLYGSMRDFMAKLAGWYDQTIDRVDAAFTGRARQWTTGISCGLVLVLQLDSFDLLARLNADGALRDKVVASAIRSMERLKPSDSNDASKTDAARDPSPAPGGPVSDGAQQAESEAQTVDPSQRNDSSTGNDPGDAGDPADAKSKAIACANTYLKPSALSGSAAANAQGAKSEPVSTDPVEKPPTKAGLAGYANCMGLSEATKLELIAWPTNWGEWWGNWKTGLVALSLQLTGMLLSLGLLSLGAPFWYEILSNLIKMRSIISRKDEAARTERQTTQVG